MTLADPGAAPPLVVMDMGASHVIAGLVSSLRFFGWRLPLFFVAGPLQRLPHVEGVDHPSVFLTAALLALGGYLLSLRMLLIKGRAQEG